MCLALLAGKIEEEGRQRKAKENCRFQSMYVSCIFVCPVSSTNTRTTNIVVDDDDIEMRTKIITKTRCAEFSSSD